MQTVFIFNTDPGETCRESFHHWNNHVDLEWEWLEDVDAHSAVWQRLIQENLPFILCGDNAILRADFADQSKRLLEQLAEGWDFLGFAFDFDASVSLELIPHQQFRWQFTNLSMTETDLQVFVEGHQPCVALPLMSHQRSCAFALSPKAAKQLSDFGLLPQGPFSTSENPLSTAAKLHSIFKDQNKQFCAYCTLPPLAIPRKPRATLTRVPADSLSEIAGKLMAKIHVANPYQNFDHQQYRVDLQGTFLNPVFRKVFTNVQPKLVVEVGSWKGDSAIQFAALIQELKLDSVVLCIDTWLGSVEHRDGAIKGWDIRPYLHHGYPQMYYQFLANVMHHHCQDRIIPLPNTTSNAARWLKQHKITADFIYIDASHDEDDVYSDLCLYWQILNPGGVLCGDDWSAYWYGVICAVNRFAKENRLPLKTVQQQWFLQKPAS